MALTNRRAAVLEAVAAERDRQAYKWSGPHAWGSGDCSSSAVADTTKLAVLLEEAGEVARALLDGNKDQMRTELVHLAAVAVAWLEEEHQ